MKIEKLVYMANQIGKFFAAQREDEAVAGIADHIKKFWDPRMRTQMAVHVETGGEGLSPQVKKALQMLHDAS